MDFLPVFFAVRKSFPLKGKAFLFKREGLSFTEGKLFPVFEKGVESLCVDNQCIKLRTPKGFSHKMEAMFSSLGYIAYLWIKLSFYVFIQYM